MGKHVGMTEISDRYRKLAADFTAEVAAVPDDQWAAPSPCEGWTARDVVGHVVGAQMMFLGFVDQGFTPTADVGDDPLAAWIEARDAMQAALDDPAVSRAEYDSPFGRSVFEESADRFVSNDLVVHRWDLGRAAGNDVVLDADEAGVALATYESLGDDVRNPRVFAAEVEVDDRASTQDRLLGFTGRDPRE